MLHQGNTPSIRAIKHTIMMPLPSKNKIEKRSEMRDRFFHKRYRGFSNLSLLHDPDLFCFAVLCSLDHINSFRPVFTQLVIGVRLKTMYRIDDFARKTSHL